MADNGSGLDEHALRRIFEPFFSTKTFGAGVGLNAVREMVRGWGGEIAVASTPGVGTRFDDHPAPGARPDGRTAASALPVTRPRFAAHSREPSTLTAAGP